MVTISIREALNYLAIVKKVNEKTERAVTERISDYLIRISRPPFPQETEAVGA